MPVHKYRVCLHQIAPFISRDKTVVIGAAYGQGGFNWMVEEIRKEYGLSNIVEYRNSMIQKHNENKPQRDYQLYREFIQKLDVIRNHLRETKI